MCFNCFCCFAGNSNIGRRLLQSGETISLVDKQADKLVLCLQNSQHAMLNSFAGMHGYPYLALLPSAMLLCC